MNDFFARSHATAMPGMQIASVQKTATLAESSSASISAALNIKIEICPPLIIKPIRFYGFLRMLNPYFLKTSKA
ncbi:MAG: hypothetical protein ABIU85_09330, partial [Methylotenera sp.]